MYRSRGLLRTSVLGSTIGPLRARTATIPRRTHLSASRSLSTRSSHLNPVFFRGHSLPCPSQSRSISLHFPPLAFSARHPYIAISARLALSTVLGLGVLVGVILFHDAFTYSERHVDRVPANPLSLHPRLGGKKGLPIIEVNLDDDEDEGKREMKGKPRLVVIGGGWGVGLGPVDCLIQLICYRLSRCCNPSRPKLTTLPSFPRRHTTHSRPSFHPHASEPSRSGLWLSLYGRSLREYGDTTSWAPRWTWIWQRDWSRWKCLAIKGRALPGAIFLVSPGS